MVVQVDPYATTNALTRGYDMADQVFADRARRQAGNALAGGDMKGAVGALGGVGDLEGVVALQGADQRWRRAELEYQQGQQEQVREFMLRSAVAMRSAPADMRGQVYQQLRPTLEQIYPPEVMAQIDASSMDDASLDALISALGGESRTYQSGGNIVEVGAAGQVRPIWTAPQDPLEREYMQARIDAARAQVGQREASAAASRARAARTGSSGGGSRRSGGRSRPVAPASPSRKPWERF